MKSRSLHGLAYLSTVSAVYLALNGCWLVPCALIVFAFVLILFGTEP